MTPKTICALALSRAWIPSGAALPSATQPQSTDDGAALTRTLTELDAKLFDAYNRCDMDTFREFFVQGMDFHPDQGGATFDLETVIENTRTTICHKNRRELLNRTFRVYPVRDYGAIEEGEHRFCQVATGKCEGIANILLICQNKDGKWLLRRIISVGHREMTANEKAASAALASH